MVASVSNPASLSLAQLAAPQPRQGDARSGETRGADRPQASAPIDSDSTATPATLAAVRDGLQRAMGALDLALAGGQAGLDALRERRAEPSAAFTAFAIAIEDAIASGAGLLRGESLRAPLEPGAPPLELLGEDLRIAESADRSPAALEALEARAQQALDRFGAAARRLEGHSDLIARLDGAIAADVKPNLDAEGARLAALQISQSLAERGDGFGAGAPQALLALFRS